jgi:hypothetical protein
MDLRYFKHVVYNFIYVNGHDFGPWQMRPYCINSETKSWYLLYLKLCYEEMSYVI